MAKATVKQDESAPTPVKKRNSKKLLVLITAVIVIIALGAGAAIYVLKHRQASRADNDMPARTSRHNSPPMFVRLDSFTVKLQPDADSQEQYLQATPELRVLNSSVADQIKLYMPEIRYKTLLLLSSKRPSEISTPQGVEQLSVELRATINQILDGSNTKPVSQAKAIADPNDSTQAVLFTAFIIQ